MKILKILLIVFLVIFAFKHPWLSIFLAIPVGAIWFATKTAKKGASTARELKTPEGQQKVARAMKYARWFM